MAPSFAGLLSGGGDGHSRGCCGAGRGRNGSSKGRTSIKDVLYIPGFTVEHFDIPHPRPRTREKFEKQKFTFCSNSLHLFVISEQYLPLLASMNKFQLDRQNTNFLI